MPFAYPAQPHTRRHGPQGYTDYRSFKPWLRDEFTFRCVYCLLRERWAQDGQDIFSADHCLPQQSFPHLVVDYEDLLYACVRCNSCKQAVKVLDPCQFAFGEHIRTRNDGEIEGLSREGERLIRVLQLNIPRRVEYRRRLLDTLRQLRQHAPSHPEAQRLLEGWLGFPDDLPDLESLRPPAGNSRPEGARQCHFARRQRGELPPMY